MSSAEPPRWPSDVQYLCTQRYHSSVPNNIRDHLLPKSQTRSLSSTAPPVSIKQVTTDNHPAKGQRGLFATRKIPPRTHIIDYVGEVHCDERPNSDYDLSLYRSPEGVSVGVDASRVGNEARFINDYRGVALKPNALFEERRNAAGELCMAVWSGKEEVRKGQEILVSYGKGFWQARSSSTAESACDACKLGSE
ncbi:hypothetical protein PHLGIDRAFT_475381 [Phlebiopsis gigantea 11061_1 CR5-6]|uniref:SET domain-containing protein n=1 Tax=Phlebiopsis gigantea (strain 11061_1 CR5-6) TaxID=745531 RepID=A0A0C3SF47_PHLG1|nr:hypothetical protein PHLGIDRAFT_475381 [Phlebiopsis gigantea 11061_1 CR5-6]